MSTNLVLIIVSATVVIATLAFVYLAIKSVHFKTGATHTNTTAILEKNNEISHNVSYLRQMVGEQIAPQMLNIYNAVSSNTITAKNFGAILDEIGYKYKILTENQAVFCIPFTGKDFNTTIVAIFNGAPTLTFQSTAFTIAKSALDNARLLSKISFINSSMTVGAMTLIELEKSVCIIVSAGLPIADIKADKTMVKGMIQTMLSVQKMVKRFIESNELTFENIDAKSYIAERSKLALKGDGAEVMGEFFTRKAIASRAGASKAK